MSSWQAETAPDRPCLRRDGTADCGKPRTERSHPPSSKAALALTRATHGGTAPGRPRQPVLRSPAAMPLTVSNSASRSRGSGSPDSAAARERRSSETCR
jgi:hypothetical protein